MKVSERFRMSGGLLLTASGCLGFGLLSEDSPRWLMNVVAASFVIGAVHWALAVWFERREVSR